MRARAALILACVIGIISTSAAPASAGQPEVVVGTAKWEFAPAASSSFVAWTQPRITRDAFRSTVFAREIATGETFRVSPRGAVATTGGIDGSTLVYDLDGDLALFDLATRTELDVPSGVNRRNATEYSPGISGSRLLFVRTRGDRNSIVLYDLSTGTTEVLYSKPNTSRRLFVLYAGQVNGNFAVWGQDVRSQRDGSLLDADVRVHDIAAGTTTTIPKPDGTLQYASSVSSDGTVYLGRSGFGCGVDVELIARSSDGTESVVYDFPRGRDLAVSNVVDHADGTTDVYFDPGRCRGDPPNQDIWRTAGLG